MPPTVEERLGSALDLIEFAILLCRRGKRKHIKRALRFIENDLVLAQGAINETPSGVLPADLPV